MSIIARLARGSWNECHFRPNSAKPKRITMTCLPIRLSVWFISSALSVSALRRRRSFCGSLMFYISAGFLSYFGKINDGRPAIRAAQTLKIKPIPDD